MKFVDVKNDIAFRKIFGNEKKTNIVISFLNAVLKLEGDKSINEVQFVNPFLLPRVRGEKASIIDIRAKDETGRQFVIEMQVASVEGFGKRVQYYTCRDYSSQIKEGEHYKLLKPTYFIGILDFTFFDSPQYLSHHIIVNGETYEHKLKDIQFAFIELRKFHLTEKELKTLIEKWVFFIKNAPNLEVIPSHVIDDGLKEAYKDADKHSWNREELIAYDNASIAIQDARGKLEAAKKEGLSEGLTKGIKKGIKKGETKNQKESILRGYKGKIPIEVIAEIVGLSIEEVKRILKDLNA